jgi:hypothetical protein
MIQLGYRDRQYKMMMIFSYYRDRQYKMMMIRAGYPEQNL